MYVYLCVFGEYKGYLHGGLFCWPYLFENLILFVIACVYFCDAKCNLCVYFFCIYVHICKYIGMQYVYIIYPYLLWAEFIWVLWGHHGGIGRAAVISLWLCLIHEPLFWGACVWEKLANLKLELGCENINRKQDILSFKIICQFPRKWTRN